VLPPSKEFQSGLKRVLKGFPKGFKRISKRIQRVSKRVSKGFHTRWNWVFKGFLSDLKPSSLENAFVFLHSGSHLP